jgi:carbamoyltransferase
MMSFLKDFFRCFMGVDMEVLAIGNCFLRKEEQDLKLTKDYKSAFELDGDPSPRFA